MTFAGAQIPSLAARHERLRAFSTVRCLMPSGCACRHVGGSLIWIDACRPGGSPRWVSGPASAPIAPGHAIATTHVQDLLPTAMHTRLYAVRFDARHASPTARSFRCCDRLLSAACVHQKTPVLAGRCKPCAEQSPNSNPYHFDVTLFKRPCGRSGDRLGSLANHKGHCCLRLQSQSLGHRSVSNWGLRFTDAEVASEGTVRGAKPPCRD